MLLLIANSEANSVPIEIRDILRCVISIDPGTDNRKIMQKGLIKEKAKKFAIILSVQKVGLIAPNETTIVFDLGV